MLAAEVTSDLLSRGADGSRVCDIVPFGRFLPPFRRMVLDESGARTSQGIASDFF